MTALGFAEGKGRVGNIDEQIQRIVVVEALHGFKRIVVIPAVFTDERPNPQCLTAGEGQRNRGGQVFGEYMTFLGRLQRGEIPGVTEFTVIWQERLDIVGIRRTVRPDKLSVLSDKQCIIFALTPIGIDTAFVAGDVAKQDGNRIGQIPDPVP